MTTPWFQQFPELAALADPAWRDLASASSELTLPAGVAAFRPGDLPAHYLLILEGRLRVQLLTATGHEIVLYRVGKGEPCVLTTSCLLASEPYPAEGITETAVRAVAIPARIFHQALAASEGFRAFALASFARRLSNLIGLVQNVAFGRVEARLATLLLEQADAKQRVTLTHQALATELGTAREVVSRKLKALEQRHLLRLSRGAVEILDVKALRALARSHAL